MASMKYVGLDVHKESIAVAVAEEGSAEVRYHGTIGATTDALRKLVRRLGSPQTLRFAYEAGPCGYGVYRTLTSLGASCAVVASSLIPQRAGDRSRDGTRGRLTRFERDCVQTEAPRSHAADRRDHGRESPRAHYGIGFG